MVMLASKKNRQTPPNFMTAIPPYHRQHHDPHQSHMVRDQRHHLLPVNVQSLVPMKYLHLKFQSVRKQYLYMLVLTAIGTEHCAPEPTTLMIREKESLPKDEFHIIDKQTEIVAFQVRCQVLCRRDKKQLLDTFGNEIARFKITIISLHKIFRVYTSSKDTFMSVKRKFGAEKSKMVAEVKNLCDDGRIMKFEAVGDWKGRNAVISNE